MSNNHPPTRIPNLLHLCAFLALTIFVFLCCESLAALIHPHDVAKSLADQRLQLFINIATYALALAAAQSIFPLLWHRSFADGIAWNPRGIRAIMPALGFSMGILSLVVSSLLPRPAKPMPIEEIFTTPGIIWVLVLFGVVVAPIFEEIVFRGFLLPGIAVAIDYLRLPRDPDPLVAVQTLNTWRTGKDSSRPALIASAVITSTLFGLIHAAQLGFSWPSVALLAAVSLVLCYIRIRSRSVAASTIVHGCYNFAVFFALFIGTNGFRHMDRM